MATTILSMAACSSPEKDGEKAAKAYCSCAQKYPSPSEEGIKCFKKADEAYEKGKEKYATNEQKLSEFKYAYEARRKSCWEKYIKR